LNLKLLLFMLKILMLNFKDLLFINNICLNFQLLIKKNQAFYTLLIKKFNLLKKFPF
jgi:hypothetical protein